MSKPGKRFVLRTKANQLIGGPDCSLLDPLSLAEVNGLRWHDSEVVCEVVGATDMEKLRSSHRQLLNLARSLCYVIVSRSGRLERELRKLVDATHKESFAMTIREAEAVINAADVIEEE